METTQASAPAQTAPKYKLPSIAEITRLLALRDARTILRFQELESLGLVRLNFENEQENYFEVYGREDNPKYQKARERALERMGCVCVMSEYFDGADWQLADSIGMCVYERPESPFENCYVPQLMAEAVSKAEALLAEPAERYYWEAREVATVGGGL